MKRIAAAAAFLLLYGSFAPAYAATLRPIDQEGLNLRAGPGTGYAIVGGLAVDQSATVLGKEGDWYRIRLTSGTEGWVAGWYSRVLLDDEQRFAVATDVLNVRRVPTLTATVVAQLALGQQVRLLEMDPEWWRIRLDNGTEGWVSSRYIRQVAPGTPAPAPTPTPAPTPAPAPAPAPSPGTVVLTPPPAPLGAVPELGLQPPRTVTPLPGKTVQVKLETGIYAGPDVGSSRIATVRPTDTLRLLESSGGWVRTETMLGQRGWVPGNLVQIADGRLRLAFGDRAWALEALTAAPTPAPTPAPAPAPGAVYRTVKDPEGLNLRLVPSMLARVLAVLPQGELLQVLETDGVWLRVKTAAGLTGWVHGDYTLPYGDQSQTPAPAPVLSGDGFKVTMEQPFTGASRLVVQTSGKAIGQPVQTESSLVIPFETGETAERILPVNILGVKQASVTPQGLKLEVVGKPSLKVEEAAPGKLSLLLRPVLQGIRTEVIDSKSVYRFDISGDAKPVAREAGGNIIVEIPGAVLAAPLEIPGIRVVQYDTLVRIAIPSYRTFALKRSDQGYYLVVYPSGLAGKAILLDPGHGGDDVGAVYPALGLVEKTLNLEVALRVRAMLEAKGAKVYMTRATDRRVAPESFLSAAPGEPRDQLDMLYRSTMANQMKSDLFLAIHHNAGDPGMRGTENFFTSTTLNGERARTAGRLIQEEMIASLGTVDRGSKDDTYYVTRNTDAPAVLVEVGFVTDPAEALRVKEPVFQEATARAIVRALERFYAERPH